MITIFTPTYNRAYCLTRLYQSLCKQTYVDFEWLLIDDGSTDNTEKLIDTFRQENNIQIRYYYVPNGGKSRAINKGTLLAKGELFFVVDSDDYLTPDALYHIEQAWSKVSQKEQYIGLCFRKILKSTKEIIGGSFLQPEFDSDSLELSYRYKKNVDKAEVFHTKILKKFPFPEIKGENFVPEALLLYRIAAANFKLHCIDIGIYICEYLPDGLTNNFKSNLKKNCKGFALYYREVLTYSQIGFFPHKIKAFIRLLQCKIYMLSQ